MARRRQRPIRRVEAKAVLVLTNGQRTEREYFERLKKFMANEGVSLTVKFNNRDANGLLEVIRRGDYSNYSSVWIVVDHDGTDRSDFLTACAQKKRGMPPVFGVVSRPCFEVWLVAHYERVKKYGSQRDVQRHYLSISRLSDNCRKCIPDDFPFGSTGVAVEQCLLVGERQPDLNEQGPSPSTGMPHLVRELGLVKQPIP